MATTTSRFASFYNDKRAASDLRKYRKNGPIPSTRALIDALKAEGVEGVTLLASRETSKQRGRSPSITAVNQTGGSPGRRPE